MKLSLCIATYNEERNIHYPVESAMDLADEVVIVDGGSTDRTVEVAKSYGKSAKGKVRVYEEKFEAMFHKNKQKAIERAKGEWILQLDADEELSEELKEEIKQIINPKSEIRNPKQTQNLNVQNTKSFDNLNLKHSDLFRDSNFDIRNFTAFYLPRKNFFLTRFLTKGGQFPDYTIRLYKNGAARFPLKSIHENVELIPTSEVKGELNDSQTSEVKNKIGYLKNPILHYADPNFSRYLQRWDRYTTLEAENLVKTRHASSLHFLDYFFLKPSLWFFSTYFRHLGFMDGFPGFVFSLFSAIRFWVIYVKWWRLKN